MGFFDKFALKNQYVKEFVSELISTFVFILMGEASFTHFLFANQKDVFAVVFVWGIAVMLGIYSGAGISGGHVNPIVTTGLASVGKFPWKKVPHYILGQHLGAFFAVCLLYINYMEQLNAYDGGVRSTIENATSTGILWTTYPDKHASLATCVLDTIICSGYLMFAILVILDEKNAQIPKYLHAFLIGLVVMALCWAFGVNCMAGINPARDFPPRVFSALAGYGTTPFTYRHFWWIPMFVPHLGGSLGCWLYTITLGVNTNPPPPPPSHSHELKGLMA